jgi:hypothetical protein
MNQITTSTQNISIGNPKELLDSIDKCCESKEPTNWSELSSNPALINLLIDNQDKIDWFEFNKNPAAIDTLRKNPNKINWNQLNKNPNRVFF